MSQSVAGSYPALVLLSWGSPWSMPGGRFLGLQSRSGPVTRAGLFVPSQPVDLVTLLAEWTATNADHIRAQGRLLADDHVPIYRRTVHRIVARIGINAGVGHVHPHQLRHTLATQAINRGMRLEAIAALLGHRSLEMTLVYARIADRSSPTNTHRCANRSTPSTTPPPPPAPSPPRSRPRP